ncbi:MAG: histidine--tRNA ligase [Lachnospiraceae bacterium]|nr:histidine--tRNA ligase [Lachnospiraceae bacterium]
MPLKKTPVNGMKDILPSEMQIRDYVIGLIKETYKSFGFTPIDTPSVEHIENLTSKQGGENEKLIFRILKRGEKLKLDTAENADELVDSGLRYDLTVPLVRYFSNHVNELPVPFKALQIGYVWRADRPQRGRYRQFMQCDIDILGDESNMAEIELILATGATLAKLGFKNFQIRINDRRILKAMAAYSGFLESEYDSVFITLDKMDKIGFDGVCLELKKNGFKDEDINRFKKLIGSEAASQKELFEALKNHLEPNTYQNITDIIASVEMAKKTCPYEIIFDPTLVRGMAYYTGTIFEVAIPEFGGSCGGGGRYDKMIGNFTGKDVPGVGFSIGFERIILLLIESGFVIPSQAAKKAYLIEKGTSNKITGVILSEAQAERDQGKQVLVTRMNKNKRFQKEQLAKEGYLEIKEVWKE